MARQFAATEALIAGRGGIKLVSKITGIARFTIGRGIAELDGKTEPTEGGRVRVVTVVASWRLRSSHGY